MPAIQPPSADTAAIQNLTEKAGLVIARAREAALEPNLKKVLRKWTLTEAAELLGVTQKVFASRLQKGNLPTGEREGKRRLFGLDEVHTIQERLNLLPRQRMTIDGPVVIAVANFKGGVGKTSTAIHLAQYFALRGYRALAVDLDAQASLTSLFGILPDSEVDDTHTVLPWFFGANLDPAMWTGTLASAIQPTYWPGLDLIAANLSLYGAEFALARRQSTEKDFAFYRQLREGLDTVADRYDVIIVDTPPSLSFITTNALFAADGLIIPVPPAMLDFASATHFFSLLKDIVQATEQQEGRPLVFEFLGLLISKFQQGNAVHQQISNWVRGIFGDYTLASPMVLTTVFQNIGPQLLSAYEVQDYKGDRRTFRRALDSLNLVNAEVERLVQAIWRRRADEAAKRTPAANAA